MMKNKNYRKGILPECSGMTNDGQAFRLYTGEKLSPALSLWILNEVYYQNQNELFIISKLLK